MVEPISPEERKSGNGLLKAVFVLLVTASAGLIVLQAGSTTAELLAALAGGFVFSLLLMWYVVRILSGLSTGPTTERRNRR
ncbi:hypothetical protein ACERIT_13760 [Halopenitus sp. H-Gu1]|uniref:hypothetical protein n=1 Tax=Halopenitus sp. H-Gu1 TaxID=3242697 RepID=UPI00359ED444